MQQKLQPIALAALGGAFLLLMTAQFVPWFTHEGTFDMPGFQAPGFSQPGSSHEWGMGAFLWSATVTVDGASSSESWYNSDWKDVDGIGALRAAAPLVVTAMLLTVGACVLALMRFGNASGVLGLAAVFLGTLGLVLHGIGSDQVFGDAARTFHVGFFATLTALLALVAGSVAAILQPDEAEAPAAQAHATP